MEFTQNRTIKVVSVLLLLAAISQPIYTVLYLAAPEFDRTFLWKLEAPIFVLLAIFSGSALVMAKRYTVGFSAIAFSAILNVVQVGVGLTLFGPFRDMATTNPEISGLAVSVVAFSFFVYNAAKVLLGVAAMVFGMANIKKGGKLIGRLTVLVGAVAVITNTIVMMFGLEGILPPPVAGGSGVLATVFLAICLLKLNNEN